MSRFTPGRILRRGRQGAAQLSGFFRMDRQRGDTLSLRMLRQGFFSYRAQFYAFDRYDARWFVNDWAVEQRFRRINPPEVQAQLGNKLFLHLLLRELGFADRVAPLLGVLADGCFTSFSPQANLRDAIAASGRVFVKPVEGYGGRGAVRIGPDDAVPPRGMFVVEAALQQHPYAAAIFPGSVNTIRVVTLRLNGDEPFIAGAAHRFGRRKSEPVDNFSQGGVAAFVDLATGMLACGRAKPCFAGPRLHVMHPDTGARIEGAVVPCWTEIKTFALELMRRVPGAQMVGWDICLTLDGPRLIEGNGSVPNPDLIQAHRPLLLDRPTRAFFRAKRVITQKHFDELEQLDRGEPHQQPAAASQPIHTAA